MKKYFFIPTGNQVWIDVAIDLYKRGVAEPVLWIGDDIHYAKARNFFGQAVVSRQEFIFYPERIRDIDYNGEYVDFFLSDNYLRAKDRCLKMMDRLDMYGTFGRLDREVIFNKLSMWALMKINANKPDAIVFAETPHSHTYYLLYEIFLYLDLEVVKFNSWPTIPLLFLQDMKTGDRYKKEIKIDSEVSKIIDKDILSYINYLRNKKDGHEYELSYMKTQRQKTKLRSKAFNFLTSGLSALIKEYWFQTRMYFSPFYYPINPYKLGIFGRHKIKNLRKKSLLRSLKVSQDFVNLQCKYIYFSLHFEPERTTNPDGGVFHDQLLAITRLRSLVPKDIKIIVKEHPSQFYMPERGTRGRSPLFYECLKNISGVELAAINMDSIDLIKNSIFTATITGSTAFESSILGKQALVFGDAWFNGCPNITLWDKDISFDKITGNKVAAPEEIIAYLTKEKKLYAVPGCLNPTYQKRVAKYLSDEFSKSEFKGVSHLLEIFFHKLNSSHK